MRDEIRMEDVKLSLIILWKKRMIVVAITLLFFAAGMIYTMTKSYQTVYVADASIYSATTGSYQQSLTGISAMMDYVDIVTSNKVCERAIALMGDSDITVELLQRMVIARFSEDSYILHVYAYSADSELAIKVANYLAEAFVIEMRSITGSEAVQLLDAASQVSVSQSALKQKLKVYLVVVGAGFLLTCMWIFFQELFSGRIQSINQCMYDEDDRVLGVLPINK